jgi:hypothetical protein
MCDVEGSKVNEYSTHLTSPVDVTTADVSNDLLAGRRQLLGIGCLAAEVVHDLLQMHDVAKQRDLAVLWRYEICTRFRGKSLK